MLFKKIMRMLGSYRFITCRTANNFFGFSVTLKIYITILLYNELGCFLRVNTFDASIKLYKTNHISKPTKSL